WALNLFRPSVQNVGGTADAWKKAETAWNELVAAAGRNEPEAALGARIELGSHVRDLSMGWAGQESPSEPSPAVVGELLGLFADASALGDVSVSGERSRDRPSVRELWATLAIEHRPSTSVDSNLDVVTLRQPLAAESITVPDD